MEVNDEMHPDDSMIHILDLRAALGLKMTVCNRSDKRETRGKTVTCPTSVVSKMLSQVDGWRADAQGKAHQCS